jgi:hypothetical protein
MLHLNEKHLWCSKKFIFIAEVAGVEPQSRAFWVNDVEMPFMDMPLDACLFTACPIVKDQLQHYNYSLTPNKKYPEVSLLSLFTYRVSKTIFCSANMI